MEVLLSSSTATATAVSLNLSSSHSRPSILSTSLQFTKKNSFPKFISSPRHSILHQSSTQRTLYAVTAAAAVTASSSSSVAVDREIKDKLPADIQVTEFKEPNSTLRLNVNVPPIVCEDCYQRVLLEFTKQAKVPGFRPGKKVPESILINYIGKKHVKSALIESILKRTLPHAMSSVEGRALKDSVRITTKFSDMDESFSSPKDYLRYDVLVDVEPEIIWTPENGYKDLKITVEIDSGIAAEIACETEIKRRHKALGALRIVTDRGLQAFLVIGCLLLVLLVASEAAVKDVVQESNGNVHVEDAKYGGGGRGRRCDCCRCCRSTKEKMSFEDIKYGGGGYNNGGGGYNNGGGGYYNGGGRGGYNNGGGRGCRYGCCSNGCC